MSPPIHNLFVLDTNASWIRSFLHAMPAEVKIHGFRVSNIVSYPGGICSAIQQFAKWERVTDSWDETWIPVPSWHKAFAVSSEIVANQVRRAIRRFGKPDAILFTLPWYAKIAERMTGIVKAYYAHDTFRFYDWDRNNTIACEGRLLRSCDLGFGVARRVISDLQELADTPVHYLPMATTWTTEENTGVGEPAAEADLETMTGKRVGCIGQISENAYDWDLIDHLSESFPDTHFMFIGPKFCKPASSGRVDASFRRPNVHWLGPKPHAHLPAYLRSFDVCINPLAVTDHNHRRSPLRLFDYLTTDRPIVSTAIDEARAHEGLISIAADQDDFRRLLAEALRMTSAPDLARRAKYIRMNTWQQRAETFCAAVASHIAASGHIDTRSATPCTNVADRQPIDAS